MSLFSTETVATNLPVTDSAVAASVLISAVLSALLLRSELKRKEKLHHLRDVFTANSRKKPHHFAAGITALALVAGVVTAKLAYLLAFAEEFLEAPLFILLSPQHFLTQAALPGAIICAGFAGVLRGFRPLQWLDALTPAILWYGLSSSVLLHGIGLLSLQAADLASATAFRIVPYAVLLNLLLFSLAWFLRKAISAPGILFACYLIFSAIIQLHLHFRNSGAELSDPVFTSTGLAAMALALIGILLLYVRTRINRLI